MGLSKRTLDELNRTEPSEYEPERPEYPWWGETEGESENGDDDD